MFLIIVILFRYIIQGVQNILEASITDIKYPPLKYSAQHMLLCLGRHIGDPTELLFVNILV